jgi:hypothetical protein
MISGASNRPVVHHRLSIEQLTARFAAIDIPSEFARALSLMDGAIAGGAEDRITETVEAVTHKHPKTFAAFVQENASSWTV